MGKWKLQLAAVLGAVALTLVLGMPGASAGCHRFSTEVSPANVQEGGTVTLVVSRDNSLADSNVRVSTVDGSATGGSDFAALNQQVNFTGSETQRSFQIQITDDPQSEGPETFNVHLSEPGGCSVNPNFSLGPDRTATIAASDAAPAATTRPAAAATTRPAATATTPTTAPATTTSEPATTTSSSAPAEETTEAEDDGGLSSGAIAAIVVLVLIIAGAVVAISRRRRA
jgi:Calx-beta domain-containing protein